MHAAIHLPRDILTPGTPAYGAARMGVLGAVFLTVRRVRARHQHEPPPEPPPVDAPLPRAPHPVSRAKAKRRRRPRRP